MQQQHGMYGERADLYDRIYSFKDYAAETARLHALLFAAGVPDGARVVEAACGTGSYLVHLARHYAASGFDLSDAMLAVARKKVPGAHLWRADMADFEVDRPADALVCLFSSFGYVTPDRIAAAAACFHRAVRPGGVAFIEPWITPEQAGPGHMSVQTYDGEKATPPESMKLVRAATHLTEGRTSHFDFHWLVLTPQGTEHFVEHHELWQPTGDEMCDAFRAAGFDATWLAAGPLTGRGSLFLRR